MSEKFQGKYRIKSARLENWDYSENAAYFITICTQNRESYFGDLSKGKMILSEIGEIVDAECLKTFEMRPDMNLMMDAYVVMPNHFHGIVTIGDNPYNTELVVKHRDAMHCASTDTTKNKFGPQSKNLASIIRGFKIGVTKHARKIHADFEWQSRFHDHILRNDKSFQRIRDYIKNNPLAWAKDKFHTTV
ncbi:transposase [Marinifilum sp. RC60d5]|uniref:transposase n=1 Tax=Marinifilum sp. RC60d5 TaxID=3458414 RepID=UPI0040370BD0